MITGQPFGCPVYFGSNELLYCSKAAALKLNCSIAAYNWTIAMYTVDSAMVISMTGKAILK